MTTRAARLTRGVAAVMVAAALVGTIGAQSRPPAAPDAVVYVVSLPEPEHHWLQVDATFPSLGTAPLRAYMSRSSPGRYAVHEFAKNVFSVEAYDGRGARLRATRPNPYEWDVAGHDGTVRLVYRVFGNLVDGTYLAVDTTHAHMNMPATFMFDLDRQARPMRVTFVRPSGQRWSVGTQLYPTSDPMTFTAPNLQYFMDSPTEFSDFLSSSFTLPNGAAGPATFRLLVHAAASAADVSALGQLVERLVREAQSVFGEFPAFEPGAYSFLLDYWPSNGGDGMEHRNSTVITEASDAPLARPDGRQAALDSIAHEFFHTWNVERIRPAGLEPFDFTRANMTCCLWLAEGFTQYYGPLLLTRAGLRRTEPPADPASVINGAGRHVRSAVEMSEYAAFSDAARSVDPTDQSRSFISYYSYGAAIALGLDLSLRDTSGGRVSLDDFMRALWLRYGKPAAPQPGLVATPYDLRNLRAVLADVAHNRAFADDFFDRYVEGREVMDYRRLLALAGYDLRARRPNAAWTGVSVQPSAGGLVVRAAGGLVSFDTPAYEAGLETGDVIKSIDGQPATLAAWTALLGRAPGVRAALETVHRGGVVQASTLTLAADPDLQMVDLGAAMSAAQRSFRASWLGTKMSRVTVPFISLAK